MVCRTVGGCKATLRLRLRVCVLHVMRVLRAVLCCARRPPIRLGHSTGLLYALQYERVVVQAGEHVLARVCMCCMHGICARGGGPPRCCRAARAAHIPAQRAGTSASTGAGGTVALVCTVPRSSRPGTTSAPMHPVACIAHVQRRYRSTGIRGTPVATFWNTRLGFGGRPPRQKRGRVPGHCSRRCRGIPPGSFGFLLGDVLVCTAVRALAGGNKGSRKGSGRLYCVHKRRCPV